MRGGGLEREAARALRGGMQNKETTPFLFQGGVRCGQRGAGAASPGQAGVEVESGGRALAGDRLAGNVTRCPPARAHPAHHPDVSAHAPSLHTSHFHFTLTA